MGTDRILPDEDWQVCSQMDTDLRGEVKTSTNRWFSLNDFWLHSLWRWEERPVSLHKQIECRGRGKRNGSWLPCTFPRRSSACSAFGWAGLGDGRKERCVCRTAEWHGVCLLGGCCSGCSADKATQGSSEEAYSCVNTANPSLSLLFFSQVLLASVSQVEAIDLPVTPAITMLCS